MSLSVETLAVARKYTDDSLAGAGAVAGVPCKIQSITAITGGNRVTFLWTDNNGDDHTSAMDVMNGVDGEDGKGIQSVTVNAQDHLIITYTDGTTVDAGQIEIHSSVDSVNGQTGAVVLDAEDVGALPDNTPIPSKTSDLTNDSGFATTSDVSTALADYTTTADLTTLLAAKQDTLTFDNAPTENSNNPVKSGGVYAANQTLESKIANEIATRTKVSGHNIGKITKPSKTGLTGLDFTVNSDGSIKVNGTSTAAWSFIMNNAMLLKAGSYTLSSGIGANPNLYVQVTSADQSASIASTANSAEKTFTLNADTIVVYRLFYLSGQTFNNVVVKPMIRLATDENADYEPYSMTNKEMTPYVQAISNPNLLDNPWFTVNQRGLSTYSNVSYSYTVDRWLGSDGFDLYVDSDGVSVSLGNESIFQRFEDSLYNFLVGKTVTLSVLKSNGSIVSISGVVKSNGNSFAYQGDSDVSLFLTKDSYANFVQVEFKNTTVKLRAVKLELGSVSTLASDTAPNYQQELAKCQRYFQLVGKTAISSAGKQVSVSMPHLANDIWFPIFLPVPLRTSPSIEKSTGTWMITQSGSGSPLSTTPTIYIPITDTTDVAELNIGAITSSSEQMIIGEAYKLSTKAEAGQALIFLSADL